MADRSVSSNDEQQLFVIPEGRGFSCFGFQNCFDESVELADAVGRPDLRPRTDEFGKISQYEGYRELVGLYGDLPKAQRSTWFGANVPDQVKTALEDARRDGRRVAITYGDSETGAMWGDRPDTGTISRSTGAMQIPILIKTSRSTGGGALLCSSIVLLQETATKRVLYSHPTLHAAPTEPEPAGEELSAPRMG